jgi:hypothetical protein
LIDRLRFPKSDQGLCLTADLRTQMPKVESNFGQATKRFRRDVAAGLEAVAQCPVEGQWLLAVIRPSRHGLQTDRFQGLVDLGPNLSRQREISRLDLLDERAQVDPFPRRRGLTRCEAVENRA